jgi:DNA replication and repair protein RecF
LQINTLRIENFRNLMRLELQLHPRLNVFYGDNGAGKTSILEALYLVARGKSFRTVRAEELQGPAAGAFRIFLELERAGIPHRIGLERDGQQWKARRDGQDVTALSELSRDLPVVLLEPNSHQLIAGAPDGRRRFLDWGVFHVEPSYLGMWRRYSRALKQRNAALRSQQLRVLESLDVVLAESGERLTVLRQAYFARFAPAFVDQLHADHAALQDIELEFQPGWKGDSLAGALQRVRQRDLDQGATSQGPHRAELAMLRHGRPVRTLLSRGEQKGLAAALLLTQARLLAETGDRPVILLDDLASEFDGSHLASVLEKARACAQQVWVTGVAPLPLADARAVFHVEHGGVREMV